MAAKESAHPLCSLPAAHLRRRRAVLWRRSGHADSSVHSRTATSGPTEIVDTVAHGGNGPAICSSLKHPPAARMGRRAKHCARARRDVSAATSAQRTRGAHTVLKLVSKTSNLYRWGTRARCDGRWQAATWARGAGGGRGGSERVGRRIKRSSFSFPNLPHLPLDAHAMRSRTVTEHRTPMVRHQQHPSSSPEPRTRLVQPSIGTDVSLASASHTASHTPRVTICCTAPSIASNPVMHRAHGALGMDMDMHPKPRRRRTSLGLAPDSRGQGTASAPSFRAC